MPLSKTAGRGAAYRHVCARVLAAAALAIVVVPHQAVGQAAVRSCATLQPSTPRAATGYVRLGVYPGGVAGALGPVAAARPMNDARQLVALERLRGSRGRPFVLHLYTAYLGAGRSDEDRLAREVAHFTRAGFQVEIVVRYRPGDETPYADVAGFIAYVTRIVERFGPNGRVIALQVTNEANMAKSADASDGAYPGARDALVQGVMAAHQRALEAGFSQLKIGFNWTPGQTTADQLSFWSGMSGGKGFAGAVDWVGIDLYPGTFGVHRNAPGAAAIRGAMLHDLATLRGCLMPLAGLSALVPIHLSENGYPTGAGRSAAEQARVLRTAVATVRGYAHSLDIGDYRWFDLRDGNSADTNFESHYGLVRDDFTPKPAFEVYRRLIARYG